MAPSSRRAVRGAWVSFPPLGFLGIALCVWGAACCTHSWRDAAPDAPEDKTVPSGCQGLFWYDFSQDDSDPGHYGKIDYVHWDKLRRTSNYVMVKQRDFGTDPDGWALLLARIKREGWPKMDFIGCDGLYTGRPEHLHVVTTRVNRFLDRYSNEVNATAPVALVLRAWSDGEEVPMCWDWLHKQLRAGLTGEPPYAGYPVLNTEHCSRIALVGFFHMKMDAQDGNYRSGLNTSELIDGLAGFASPHGWSMAATECRADD